jgi:hypothetical protein
MVAKIGVIGWVSLDETEELEDTEEALALEEDVEEALLEVGAVDDVVVVVLEEDVGVTLLEVV